MSSRIAAVVLVFCGFGVVCAQLFDLPLDQGFGLPFGLQQNQNNGLLVSVFDKPAPESRRDLLTIQQAAIEVAEQVSDCTVGLQVGNAMGSGVVISEDGYILTAAHVVGDPGRTVRVTFPDGREVEARSLGLHTTADGAMVKITENGKWPYAPLASKQQSAKTGDWCLAIGHPGGFDLSRSPPVRLGRVIDVRSTVIRTDCPIMGGDSGGPLFDLKGRVIGIHSRIAEELTENYHVPSAAYHEAWDAMKAGKLFPNPIPSKFLAELDTNNDGRLTKQEMKSSYYREVLDRLVQEFDLDQNDLSIENIAKEKFQWKNKIRHGIVEIEDVRDFSSFTLPAENYVRGFRMRDLVTKSLHEVIAQPDVFGSDVSGGNSAVSKPSDFTVRVYADGRRVALGTIVDRDGFIVTKASRLSSEDLDCQLPDGSKRKAKIVGRDDEFDLALLSVSVGKMNAPAWNTETLRVGQLAVIPGTNDDLESFGVVGVPPREIQKIRALLGIQVKDNLSEAGVPEAIVVSVVEKSGAALAGIEVGDVVTTVCGQSVGTLIEIQSILDSYRAGDVVPIVVRRGESEITLDIRLTAAADLLFDMGDSWRMSGRLSRRRDGFPAAFQIDAVVPARFCGGPVLDMNGNLLGVTLARASRVASYAISARDLRVVVERLRNSSAVDK